MRKKPSEQTIKRLFALSGNICAFPNCDEEIVDKNGNVIGEICHIEAAEKNGPRYNPNQTDEERNAIENLVLLCGKHNKIIDNDANQYTVDYLKQIKKVHESRTNRNEIVITNTLLRKINDKLDEQKQKQKPLSIIPNYDTKKLIGRKDMLDKLHKMLTENKSAILMNGIGGIGKTTVALAYCNTEKYQKEYQNIVWVTLTQSLKDSIINTFIDKDIDFKYNEKEDTERNFNHLLNTLSNIHGNNLLVLDNANNDKEILASRSDLEDLRWKLLITSRCSMPQFNEIPVDELSHDDAVDIFLRFYHKYDREMLDELIDQINRHTLLTELLANVANENPELNIRKVFDLLKKWEIKNNLLQSKIFTQHLLNNKKKQVSIKIGNYLFAIFKATNLNNNEKKYLMYFSILPSVSIDYINLKKYFADADYNSTTFNNILKSLKRKGWIIEIGKDSYKMHPLIQVVIKEKLQPNAENCKEIIINFRNLLGYEQEESPLSRKELVPFAENIWNSIYNEKNEQQILNYELATLANNLALIMSALGNYEKTLLYQNKSITINEKVLDAQHPNLATSYNNIALTYRDIGNYEKALEYQEKSINIKEKVLAPDNPSLATSYNNIALTYKDLGNYEKALEYQKKVLTIFEKVLEPDQPSLATSYKNISFTYLDLGNYAKALEYQEKAIAIREKLLDKDHPVLQLLTEILQKHIEI